MSVDQGLSYAISFTSLGVSVGVNQNLPEIVDTNIDKTKKSIVYIDLNKPVLS